MCQIIADINPAVMIILDHERALSYMQHAAAR